MLKHRLSHCSLPMPGASEVVCDAKVAIPCLHIPRGQGLSLLHLAQQPRMQTAMKFPYHILHTALPLLYVAEVIRF
jgi:hypothetical protein